METNKEKILAAVSKKDPAENILTGMIMSMQGQIKMALPKQLNYERFTRIAITCLRNNQKLMQTAKENPISYLSALMQSVQMGLEPNTPLGQAYIIPYGKEVQFQIGYLGILDLCYRSGQFKQIGAYTVYDNDEFEYSYGLEQKLIHKPAMNQSGNPIYYYAIYKMFNGGEGFVVLSKDNIIKHSQKYSQAVKKGWTSPWLTDFDAMARKTVLKILLKYAPKSIEVNNLLSQDETVKNEIKEDMTEVQHIELNINNNEKEAPTVRKNQTVEPEIIQENSSDSEIKREQISEDINKLKSAKNKAALSGFMLDIRENFKKFNYNEEEKQDILAIKEECLMELGE
jgi:recombination protein RecT